ncbi:MAG TPA: hypothetical protein VN026_00880 [Bacteroidia bacterium]|jgi:hypothetical protein|nr:hypothetical protein [Bacteroidia bacterium]
MSWIKDLDELSPSVKSFILCMACLMPFWYVSIFIFNHVLFNFHNQYLIMSLSFCFSLLWYMVSLLLNFIFILIYSRVFNLDSEEVQSEEPIILGGVDSIIYLCIAILICYISKEKYDSFQIPYHFFKFLTWAFWFAVIRVIFISAWAILIALSERPTQTQTTLQQ